MTPYKSFADKIRLQQTIGDIEIMESKLDKLFNSGVFSINEFMRLDGLIVDCKIKIEDDNKRINKNINQLQPLA